jgi:ribonucleoside-diphosphate reductase alpha chain
MQAAIQRHVDQGISSTINLARDATADCVSRIYHAAWDAGCKGVTVYREGSRDGILLTTTEAGRRQHQSVSTRLIREINRLAGRVLPASTHLGSAPTDLELARLTQAVDTLLKDGSAQLHLLPPTLPLRPRPAMLTGLTFAQSAPEGNIQVTINEVDGEPFEMICHGGKAGSDILAWVQAIARTASILLRLQRLPSPTERLQLLIEQWEGIAGSRSIGFGPERVRSGPDGIAQALQRYLAIRTPAGSRNGDSAPPPGASAPPRPGPSADPHPSNGNFCPQCHGLTLLNDGEAGCSKCSACPWKEC